MRGRAPAIATGLIALVAAYYTARNTATARRTFALSEQGQQRTHELTERGRLTDRFTAAVAQLGDPAPAIRLGGVHALAGPADDASTRQLRQTCVDVLCAYLRSSYPQALRRRDSVTVRPPAAVTPRPCPQAWSSPCSRAAP